jgi:hypothetical protein
LKIKKTLRVDGLKLSKNFGAYKLQLVNACCLSVPPPTHPISQLIPVILKYFINNLISFIV